AGANPFPARVAHRVGCYNARGIPIAGANRFPARLAPGVGCYSGMACPILRGPAEVAESVDAADSKSAALKSVWVRVPPSAPPAPADLASAHPRHLSRCGPRVRFNPCTGTATA